MITLSVLLPIYNEERELAACLDRVLASIADEIIAVDDCSTDQTADEVDKFIKRNPALNIRFFQHKVNKGKGAALHTGISEASGEYVIIQDADTDRILFFWHTIGNKLLTFLTNMFSNLNLTDMETCYKLFNTKILQSLKLKEMKFGFEPEVTIKIARIPGIRIYEVGISYYGRGYEEGKKIGWKDGFWAIYCIFKYGIFRR